MSKERLQRVYSNMKTRCYNPKSNRYHCYGGRGIKVCDEWLGWGKGFKNFEKWALLNGYADNLTIDRINNDGNYEPSNCRWVTTKKNSNNTSFNRLLTYNGETHTMTEWCEILGVKLQTLSARIYRGWSLEDVMTRPIRKQLKKTTNYRRITYEISVKDAKIDILEKKNKELNKMKATQLGESVVSAIFNVHHPDQDKISFCIERLEKVKDYFCEEDEDGDGVKTGDWTITRDACDIAEFIDNQINQLKEGK